MSYTIEEIEQLTKTIDGVAELLGAVDTRDGGEIEAPIIMQVISGCYSKSDENAILSAIQFSIDTNNNKLKYEKLRGALDTEEICIMYQKYVEKGQLVYNLVKICINKHNSSKSEDIKTCNIIYAILAKSIPGAW